MMIFNAGPAPGQRDWTILNLQPVVANQRLFSGKGMDRARAAMASVIPEPGCLENITGQPRDSSSAWRSLSMSA